MSEIGTTASGVRGEPPVFEGDRVGRYLVLREIGRGAMGRVYAGFDPDLRRAVAVKLVAHDLDHLATYLLREARTLAALSHPNVVPVFDVGRDAGRIYIVMELVQGMALSVWLERPRSTREIVRAWCAAGRGLAAAHAAGVIHRDFKASNVLIGEDGQIRVADFGLARSPDAAGAPAGPVEGTRPYLAPEVLESGVATEAVDQFAFAVSLHRALCGAYEGTVDPRIPRRLRGPLARGLAHDASARWPSMTAFVDALERALRVPRAVLAGGGLAVAVAAAAAWSWIAPAGDAGCEPAAAVIDRELGGARRDRLATAAGDRSARATHQLDRGLAAWSTAYDGACASPARRACLEARLADLALLIDDVAIDPAIATAEIPDALARLPDEVVACGQPRAATPDDLDSREYRRQMARSRRFGAMGLWVEATAAADAALALAGNPSAAVLARTRRLQVSPTATPAAMEALYEDARATGHDALVAEVMVVAAQRCIKRELACAEPWLDRVAKAVHETALAVPGLAAHLAALYGDLQVRRGSYAIAVAMYEEALRLDTARLGTWSWGLVPTLLDLSEALFSVGRHEESLKAATRADEIIVYWMGEHHRSRATALTDMANARIALGDRARGRAELERAIAMHLAVEGEVPAVAGLYNNLAQAYEADGDLARGLEVLDRAIAIYDRAPDQDDGYYVATVRNGAISAANLGRPDARARIDRALVLAADRLEADDELWPLLFLSRAISELRAGELDAAELDLRRAIAQLHRAREPRRQRLATAESRVAAVAIHRGRFAEARAALDRAAAHLAALHTDVDPYLVPTLYETELALALGRHDQARVHLARLARIFAEPPYPDPRVAAHHRMLAATLAERTGERAAAAAERDRALAILRAAGVPASVIAEDCIACARR